MFAIPEYAAEYKRGQRLSVGNVQILYTLATQAPGAAAGFGVMLKHSFGDGSPSLGCCIGGESPPLVS